MNIIPETAELEINVRTYDLGVRDHVLAAIERIVNAEAAASNAPRPPRVELVDSFPFLYNDLEGSARTTAVLRRVVGDAAVIDPGPGHRQRGRRRVRADRRRCRACSGFSAEPIRRCSPAPTTAQELLAVMAEVPSNHSPKYAPVIEPTLSIGVAALVAAAKEWLGTA